MALTKTITKTIDGFSGELLCADAYCKVVRVSGNKQIVKAEILVTQGETLLDSKRVSFVPDMDGENFIKQAYNHLKTLPEFADAIDC